MQAITYNNATHKKVSNIVNTYKALAHKCKEKVKLLAQHFVDSKKCFIIKEINNENLQTKLNNVQTQLVNGCIKHENNVAILIAIPTKYKQFQQQVRNMQSQLDNAYAHWEDSTATTMNIITNIMTMAATWCPRRIGLIELLSSKIVDDYGPWSYAIQEKLKTDAPMYVTEQQRVAYALLRMKLPLFDKIVVWVAENSDTIIMLKLFDETKHWMEVYLQATKTKQELITIAMKNTKLVSKYYHRIFKLWTRAKTLTDKRIVKFTRSLKSGISTPLLSCKFTSIRAVLDKA